MSKERVRVTLGVMARAPVPGRCKTRLARSHGEESAALLYEAMLLDTLDALSRVGAERTVVLAAPEHDGVAMLSRLASPPWEVHAQQGHELGERLAHAFRTLSARSDAVLLCDSDSPTIPLAPLAVAVANFSGPRRALLGPCEDGGYYLIGLTEPEIGVLRDIPWSTPAVVPRTRERCEELGLELTELPIWYDVDGPSDVERLREELAAHPERAPRTAEVLSERPRKRSS